MLSLLLNKKENDFNLHNFSLLLDTNDLLSGVDRTSSLSANQHTNFLQPCVQTSKGIKDAVCTNCLITFKRPFSIDMVPTRTTRSSLKLLLVFGFLGILCEIKVLGVTDVYPYNSLQHLERILGDKHVRKVSINL